MDDIDATLNEELDNDTQMDATLNEELDNDTQMDSTNGRGSPVFAQTRSRSPPPPPERSVVDSQRVRERLDRSQRAEARSASLNTATDALNRAREDRATSSTPAAATVESRGRKKSSIIWNHCT